MKLVSKTIKFLSIVFLSITFLGCEVEKKEFETVTAEFTYTVNQETGLVKFINTSTKATMYNWSFGDGTTSSEINPTKTYPTGVYTVVLTAKNVAGSSATFEDEIYINIPEPIEFPITFDNPNVDYGATAFNGASFAVVANPDPTGANTDTSNVGAITNIGAAYEGLFFELGEPLDLATNKTVKIKFWSNTPVAVLFKLEQGTAANTEVVVNHGGTGWEILYFTFDSAGSYSQVTIFVDGPGTTAGTFYMDDLEQINSADVPCLLTDLEFPIDFDCNGIEYATKIVGNVSFTVVENPELSGINNTATMVGKMTNVGQNWENAFFNLDTPINFSVNSGVSMKLYSTQALPILLKFEDGTEAPVENVQNHGGTGWETLTFSLASTASYNDMVIFIDGPGTAAGTFYVDDIKQVADPNVACTETNLYLPIDFDCAGINYESKRIPGDIGFSIIDNPQVNGINNVASKVGKITNVGNNWENLNFRLDTPINFSTDKSIKLKLYSTQALPIKLKVEGGGTPVENDQNHTGSGWEELTFTLGTSESFTNLIVFIDGPGNAVGTFYIDDIEQITSGGGGGSCPAPPAGDLISNGDFEAGEGCWQLINNGGETTISNTESNGGGSKSAQIKTAPAKNPGVKQERFGAGTVLPATSYTVKFDVKATDALADGAVLQAFVFSEGADGGGVGATQHVLVQGLGNVSTSWETKTYTFTSAAAAANVAGGFSLLVELVCGGATSCKGTIVVDNVSIK